MDGTNNTFGCCSGCTLEETSLGEMICSGYRSQESTCSYNACGGRTGLLCETGFVCRNDPSSDCYYERDPDCAGICVEGSTTQTPTSFVTK